VNPIRAKRSESLHTNLHFLNSRHLISSPQDVCHLKAWTIPLFFGLMILILQAVIYVSGVQLKPGELADPDCYMRLVRIEALMEGQAWSDHTILRSNAPYGETSHWSRALDVLILILALPFLCVLPVKSALFYSGVLISPLLLLISVFALAWTARPLFKKIELPHLLLLFLSQASIILFFQAGRPDHHSLLILLFILNLGFIFRLFSGHAPVFHCVGSALTQALAFAVSLEFITTIALSLGILAVAWITRHLRSWIGFLFSAALLIFCFLFYFLEQPWDQRYTVETDRMTLPHLTALTLATGYWLLVLGIDHGGILRSKTARILMTLTYALGSGYILFWLFPILLRGPYGQMDPRLDSLWLRQVQEVQPLWQTDPGGITSLFIWLSPALIVMTVLSVCFLRKKMAPDYMTWPWLMLLGSSLFFTLLTFYQIRWAYYAQTCLIFPLAAVLGHVLQISSRRLSPLIFPWVRLALLLFFCAGYVPIAVLSLGPKLIPSRPVQDVSQTSDHKQNLSALCHWLESDPQFRGTERLLAHLDFGPELLYRTHHEVIATPYHRNGSGILFLYDLMNEISNDTVLSKLRERKITIILLKPESSEQAFLNQSRLNRTFYQRLLEKDCPDFLQPINVPEPLSKSYLLYRVLPGSKGSI
jgi:hypothetical protein